MRPRVVQITAVFVQAQTRVPPPAVRTRTERRQIAPKPQGPRWRHVSVLAQSAEGCAPSEGRQSRVDRPTRTTQYWISSGTKIALTITRSKNTAAAAPVAPQGAVSAPPGSRRRLRRGFEQLNRVAIGFFELDLLTSRTGFNAISKSCTRSRQGGHLRRQIVNPENEPIPPTGLPLMTIRHRARAGTPGVLTVSAPVRPIRPPPRHWREGGNT